MRFCEYDNCSYPVFGTDKNTGKGYCRSHQTKRTDYDRRTILKKAMDKQKGLETKVRSLNSLPANKDMLQKIGKAYDENLELFFKMAYFELTKSPYCENCGEFIPEKYYRDATAHILMKSKFYSVRAHPKNKLFLGAGCGCHNESHRWDTFCKMKVWIIAVNNFKEIYPYIDDSEKKNIPDVLWKEIPDEYEKYYGNPFPKDEYSRADLLTITNKE